MADMNTHRKLAQQLSLAMHRAIVDGHWPITVDAGFYAVFHTMEALNAEKCRDSYTFADAIDILERVLAPTLLSEAFVKDYEYLFYFRRGALYGTHFPTEDQITEYVAICERAYAYIFSILSQQLLPGSAAVDSKGKTYAK